MGSPSRTDLTLTLCAMCSSRMSYGDACDHCRRMTDEMGTRADTLLLTPFINGRDVVMPSDTREFEVIPDTITVPLRDLMQAPPPGKHRVSSPRSNVVIADLPPTGQVIALIPAHNEAETIDATIACIRAQQLPPARIIVVCDNCHDNTAEHASIAGAEVFTSVDNTQMKAGALNQVLSWLIPTLQSHDLVAVIDADTVISPNFFREAREYLAVNPDTGGVSGTYGGREGGGLPGWCQRNEFARWGFDSRQQSGKAICLSGAASVFRASTLRIVRMLREAGELPGAGIYYSTSNFTEDFEMSQAILHAGYRIRNLPAVVITTAVKPTWKELHVQRLRWNRGITETLGEYGITRHTRGMWVRWVIYTLSVFVIPLSMTLFVHQMLNGGWHLNGWLFLWLSVTAIIMIHKSVTITATRKWSALFALVLIFELPYDTFLHFTFLRSLWQVIRGSGKTWR
jgi:cellulose synthase/poly-beta-1,6-N-acetylglucosamine synthase-like glycosyltransferase